MSALDAAADTAAVNAILRDAGDPTDTAKVTEAINRYMGGDREQAPARGGQTERQPERQIAEWGTELETMEQGSPGTVREAASDKAGTDPGSKSPAPVPDHDRAYQPAEIEMDLDMDM